MNSTYKDAKNIMLVLLTAVCIAVIGCRSMLDTVTPGHMPKTAANYLGEPNASGLTNLNNLRETRTEIIIKHRTEQRDLRRDAEDDLVAYQDAIGFIDTNIRDSQTMQDVIVGGAEQPFSVLGVLAGLTGGAAIGRAMKRKDDYTREEVDIEVAKHVLSAKQSVAWTTGHGTGKSLPPRGSRDKPLRPADPPEYRSDEGEHA